MWWLTVPAALALLFLVPLGISAVYNSEGVLVRLVVGPIRWTLYPKQGGQAKDKKAKDTGSGAESFESKAPQDKKAGGKLVDLLPLLRVALDFLCDFKRKLRIDRLEMKLILAGDDPCDLSVHYGRAWAALGNLMPQLERLFVIKKRNIEVECDYTSEETLVDARVDLTITVGNFLRIGVYHGVRGLREYFRLLKLRKGGAAK